MTWPAIGYALLFSLGCLVVGGGTLWIEWRYAMNSRVIDAQVTAHWSKYEKGRDGKQHYLHYLFMVDEQEIQARQHVERNAFEQYPIGATISVRYVVGSPKTSRLEMPGKNNHANAFGVIFFSVGAFFTLLMVMILLRRLSLFVSSLFGHRETRVARPLPDDL
jgi:hypothetical protein